MLTCPYCGKPLRNNLTLVTHVKNHHTDGTNCTACGLPLRSTKSLIQHTIAHLHDPQHAALYLALARNKKPKLKKKAYQTIKNPPKTNTIYQKC